MRKLVTLFAIFLFGIAVFSLFSQPAQARRHRDNCGRGFVEKIDGPGTVVYDGDDDINSIFIKTYDDHEDDCQEFYEDDNDGCYDVSGLGTSTVTVTKVGNHHCADIDHVEFYTFACEEEEEEEEPTPTPTPRPTPTPTPTPRTDIPGLSCPAGMVKYSLNSSPYTLTTWEPLKGYGITLPATSQVVIKVASMVGHPDQGCQSGSSNEAGKYPCDQGQNHEEFNVFVDDVQSGFASDHGEDKWQTFSFPLSLALSKGWHQINFRHTELGKPEKQSVDFIAAVCAGPMPTATPQPSSTPAPSPTPSATAGLGKQSKLAVTSVSCSQQNMDAIAELFEDGKPVENVTVKFIYNNEAKFAKTNKDGKAVVQYGYRNNSDLKIEPEQGYPYQLHHVQANLNCPATSTGSVLGTTTSVGKIASGVTTGEIKGMAATGIAQDLIMSMVGLTGALFSAASLRLYAKKN